jgi:hypothetical protein
MVQEAWVRLCFRGSPHGTKRRVDDRWLHDASRVVEPCCARYSWKLGEIRHAVTSIGKRCCIIPWDIYTNKRSTARSLRELCVVVCCRSCTVHLTSNTPHRVAQPSLKYHATTCYPRGVWSHVDYPSCVHRVAIWQRKPCKSWQIICQGH